MFSFVSLHTVLTILRPYSHYRNTLLTRDENLKAVSHVSELSYHAFMPCNFAMSRPLWPHLWALSAPATPSSPHLLYTLHHPDMHPRLSVCSGCSRRLTSSGPPPSYARGSSRPRATACASTKPRAGAPVRPQSDLDPLQLGLGFGFGFGGEPLP